MNASKSQGNASSAAPINWATRPKQSSGNPVTHLMAPTARRLVPVFVDGDQLRDLQEAHLGEPASQQPKCELQDYVIIDRRHFEEILHRLSQLELVLESPVFGLFDAFFELEQYRKNWAMKLGCGNKIFWGRSGLFPVHGPEIFLVQKEQFYGPIFFISRQLRNQKKRQKTGLSSTNLNPRTYRCRIRCLP